MKLNIQSFALLFCLLSTFSVVHSKPKYSDPDFRARVESFIKGYGSEYAKSAERFQSGQNDYVLEEKTDAEWKSIVTLKGKSLVRNSLAQAIHQRFYLGFFKYSSAEKCTMALDSILDSWAPFHAVAWGDTIRHLIVTPRLYIIREKELIVCTIHCEHANSLWTAFKHDLIRAFKGRDDRMIEIKCGGPVHFTPTLPK